MCTLIFEADNSEKSIHLYKVRTQKNKILPDIDSCFFKEL